MVLERQVDQQSLIPSGPFLAQIILSDDHSSFSPHLKRKQRLGLNRSNLIEVTFLSSFLRSPTGFH